MLLSLAFLALSPTRRYRSLVRLLLACSVLAVGCSGGNSDQTDGGSKVDVMRHPANEKPRRSGRALAPAAALALAPADTPAPVPSSASSSAGAAVFPLHVGGGKRYLVDATDTPFFVNGDTPWSLIVQLTREQVDEYLEDRRAKGVNTILVNLIEHEFAADPPKNAYGEGPFTTPGDFGTPNERYFDHADYVINKAAQSGILVMLTPAYVGYGGGSQGWYRELQANGTAKLRGYGQYLGNRYKGFANILWVNGGDYNVPNKNLVRAIAYGIRDFDSKPHTYHGSRGTAAMLFWGTREAWLHVNNIYTNSKTVVSAAFAEYNRSSAPFFLIEGIYEGEGASEHTVRLQAYQSVLSGATGHLMGNNPTWKFGPGWTQALNSPGARSLAYIARLFSARAWWSLEPDIENTMLTAGIGNGSDRAVAARASDGTFAVVYAPSTRRMTINLSRLAGPKVNASWYDPSSGRTNAVEGSPFLASGSRSFRPAGSNSTGHGDWILVLESTP